MTSMPPRSGRQRSMRVTFGLSERNASIASVPFEAAPTSDMSGWQLMIAQIPCRNSGWSSTLKIRMRESFVIFSSSSLRPAVIILRSSPTPILGQVLLSENPKTSRVWTKSQPPGALLRQKTLLEVGRLAFSTWNVNALPSKKSGINRPCAGPKQSQTSADGSQQNVGPRIRRLS